jgi:hypothetical protein
MYRHRISLVVLIPLLFAATPEAPKPQEFIPARFASGEDAFPSNIECPDQPDDRPLITVFCSTVVEVNGRGSDGAKLCYSNEVSGRPHKEAASRALRVSKFDPASVNLKPVPVLFSFRVFFLYEGESCEVSVRPNLGYQSEELGNDYVAPQEIRDDRGWLERLGRYSFRGTSANLSRPRVILIMSVHVSTDGKAGDSRLEANNLATPGGIEFALESLSQSRFIPGFYNGKPHPMRYYAVPLK